MNPLNGMAVVGSTSQKLVRESGNLTMWADRPAKNWMTDAFPIGNGPMGAMLFGGTELERIQFNEISLWSGACVATEGLGDEGQDLGAFQACPDCRVN